MWDDEIMIIEKHLYCWPGREKGESILKRHMILSWGGNLKSYTLLNIFVHPTEFELYDWSHFCSDSTGKRKRDCDEEFISPQPSTSFSSQHQPSVIATNSQHSPNPHQSYPPLPITKLFSIINNSYFAFSPSFQLTKSTDFWRFKLKIPPIIVLVQISNFKKSSKYQISNLKNYIWLGWFFYSIIIAISLLLFLI